MNASFEMIQGDTKILRVSVYRDTGEPIDLTSEGTYIICSVAKFGSRTRNRTLNESHYMMSGGTATEDNISIDPNHSNEAIVLFNSYVTGLWNGKYEYVFSVQDAAYKVFSIKNSFIVKTSWLETEW